MLVCTLGRRADFNSNIVTSRSLNKEESGGSLSSLQVKTDLMESAGQEAGCGNTHMHLQQHENININLNVTII